MSDAWLEGGLDDDAFETVPIGNATKAQLALATGLTITRIDRLVRDGLPVAKRGTSRKEGLRFNIPQVVQWYCEFIASRRAAAGTGFISAKERQAMAGARLRELEIAEREGTLIENSLVRKYIEAMATEFRQAMLSLPSRMPSLTEDQRLEFEGVARDCLVTMAERESEFVATLPDLK